MTTLGLRIALLSMLEVVAPTVIKVPSAKIEILATQPYDYLLASVKVHLNFECVVLIQQHDD